MLLSHLEWLCLILPTLIAATPQPTDLLPEKLQQSVPACAQPCLRRSLGEQFPLACTGSAGLTCLCSRYSYKGESLGEVALGCVYASCSSDNSAATAYNVCLGQSNAVMPTLTAVTVPPRTSTGSSTMLSSRPVVTTKPSSTIASNTPSPRPSSTDTVIADSVSLTSSPTSATSATSAPGTQPTVQPAAADPPRTMTPAQIAGLSVAAAATLIIAIGLMALSVFLRRRRERRNAAETKEKLAQTPSPRNYSTRFSRYIPVNPPTSEPPKRFPMPPAPILRKPGDRLNVPPMRNARAKSPLSTTNTQQDESNINQPTDLSSVHPLFRPGAGIRNSSSKSSLPLEQIGLAISAELPGDSPVSKAPAQPSRKTSMKQKRRSSTQQNSEILQRPDTVCTQDTVFEEDEVRDQRRESKLLPMPPVPVPPIRSFQPSREPSNSKPSIIVQTPMKTRQAPQQPELFLDIPVRHSRSQPTRILPAENPYRNAPGPSSQAAPKPQLAPAIQILPTEPRNNTTSASDLSGGDILDYYLNVWQDSEPRGLAIAISPSRLQPPHESPKVKPKFSSSTVSRANSTTSTNIRDSLSSQTSFESDHNDPTPEDEDDDRQLDGGKLSPVAESPISNLRYPKVPRASNIFVPRSPKSPLSLDSQDSPRRAPSPLSLFMKRRGEQGGLRLDGPVRTGSPAGSEGRLQTRRQRRHLRSTSDETWSTIRTSERSTRTQSGLWPKSPAMYEPDVVRPLTIRSKIQQLALPVEEMQPLKSPAWVPRLTPTRQGEDLLISVTYSKPGQ